MRKKNTLLKQQITLLFFGLSTYFIISCNSNEEARAKDNITPPENTISQINLNPLRIFPHDTSFFTEGLVFYADHLYESTGLEGQSNIAKISINDGKIIEKYKILDDKIFAEGLTLFGNKLYQLTWKNNIVFQYNLSNIHKVVKIFKWENEGWGLTNDNESLIMSNGSDTLFFINPATFVIKKTITVKNNNVSYTNINELEFINGYVYANIWYEDKIIKINPVSGLVEGEINCYGLVEKLAPHFKRTSENVLNGIAWDSKKNHIFLTGKNWPIIIEANLF